MTPKICAILITYNRLDILKKSLDCVVQQKLAPETILVVDNNSSDGTSEYISSLKYPNMELMRLEENVGSAGGIAVGMEYALKKDIYDYVWVLDDDTYYSEDTTQQLVDATNQGYDYVGLTGYNIRFGNKRAVHNDLKLQPIDYTLIDGSLIRMSVVKKIGLVDAGFFMMCDDHEYCLRAQKHGFKVGLLNIAVERLYLGGEGNFTKATLWRGYYSSRNMMIIVKKYFHLTLLLGYLFRQSKILVAALLFAPDRQKRVKYRLMGIWHGLINKKGKTLDPSTLRFR